MTNSVVTDFAQYDRMRMDADADRPGVLREVAGQFEALFVQTLLKNMRDCSLGDPIFGQSDQFEMYQGMLDQQFAVELSRDKGIGLADMLVRQMGGESSEPVASTAQSDARAGWDSPKDFAKDVWPHAERAAGKLGVAPEALLAQAALETGWGKHVMNRPGGESSYNLFGIKAAGGWSGSSVAKSTLEFTDGVAHREMAKFRAYPDVAATFDDYASFISNNPRYSSVQDCGDDIKEFATALQDAGYATDPKYADKIERVLGSDTMREALQTLKNPSQSPINNAASRTNGQ